MIWKLRSVIPTQPGPGKEAANRNVRNHKHSNNKKEALYRHVYRWNTENESVN